MNKIITLNRYKPEPRTTPIRSRYRITSIIVTVLCILFLTAGVIGGSTPLLEDKKWGDVFLGNNYNGAHSSMKNINLIYMELVKLTKLKR